MEQAFDSFNAPQFVDFSKEQSNDENADAYFDVDHENVDDQFYSPAQNTPAPNKEYKELDPLDNTSYQDTDVASNLRKSMSVGNLVLYTEQSYKNDFNKLCTQVEQLEVHQNSEEKKSSSSNLIKSGSVRTSTTKFCRKGSQDYLNKLAQPKRYTSVENLKQGNNGGKFVSLAESINQFQNRTPKRFRSKPNLIHHHSSQTLFHTVPQSPALQTKTRSRPLRVLSQEEREEIEYQNEQKFKIKAHPLNKKILHGPLKPTVPMDKKPPTVAQPFNLTTAPPKKVMQSPTKFEFHAKPIPKSVQASPKLKKLEKKEPTKPVTPTFMKHYKKEMFKSEEETKMPSDKPLVVTKPKPFSFESRDKMVQKKKEQLINKIREEEKKAREFHANPLPKSMYRRNDQDSNCSIGSSTKRTQSQENLTTQFKARPPMVLYKEPFVPVKPDKPCTEICPFQLSTEIRALEREEFEREQREKEEKFALLKKTEEERRLKQEQEEIARLRREQEYKAKPITKFKKLVIKPSNKVTEPISPIFQTDIIRMRNKENIPSNNGSL